MATRQYIGARYVPKFYENGVGSSEWTANTAYEPLTIVTRNGNSYTSKKTVPATAGAPEAAPEYWVSTGIYNQQIEQYRQETETVASGLAEAVDDIATNSAAIEKRSRHIPADRKILFIADSFGTVTNPSLVEFAGQYIGCAYTKIAAASYGFIANGTLKFINLLRNNLPADPESYTDVCVLGGNNDLERDSSDLTAAISEFITYAKSVFTNAKIHIGFDARRINVSPNNAEQTAASLYEIGAINNGAAYFDLRAWLHDSTLYGDSVHPNSSGSAYLGRGIAQYFTTGDTGAHFGLAFLKKTYKSGFSGSGDTIATSIDGHILRVFMANTYIEFTTPVPVNTFVDYADITQSMFESKTAFPTRIVSAAKITLSDASIVAGAAEIRVSDGKMEFYWDANVPSGTTAVNLTIFANDLAFSVFNC